MFNVTVKLVLLKDKVESTHTCSVHAETLEEGFNALDKFERTIGGPLDNDDNVIRLDLTLVRVY